jgi:hypothetical protein
MRGCYISRNIFFMVVFPTAYYVNMSMKDCDLGNDLDLGNYYDLANYCELDNDCDHMR